MEIYTPGTDYSTCTSNNVHQNEMRNINKNMDIFWFLYILSLLESGGEETHTDYTAHTGGAEAATVEARVMYPRI